MRCSCTTRCNLRTQRQEVRGSVCHFRAPDDLQSEKVNLHNGSASSKYSVCSAYRIPFSLPLVTCALRHCYRPGRELVCRQPMQPNHENQVSQRVHCRTLILLHHLRPAALRHSLSRPFEPLPAAASIAFIALFEPLTHPTNCRSAWPALDGKPALPPTMDPESAE